MLCLVEFDIAVVGGCGHVGLPLAVAFAGRGARTAVYDVNAASVTRVRSGFLPFDEPGAAAPLARAVSSGQLVASDSPAVLAQAGNVIVVIGTPVDELGPDPDVVPRTVAALRPYLREGQLLVLRSTVFPGVTAKVEALVAGLGVEVAYCPERIAEGKAMTELFELPQLVGARTVQASLRAHALFGRIAPETVGLSPEEAELAKLFANAWRYAKFAAANSLYMVANDHGLDYDRIRNALALGYPRAADLPGAGFAGGPCLGKDTAQLGYPLGNAVTAVNENLPGYLAGRLAARYDLGAMTVGILGMAFKGGSDDTRASLAYKLKRLLEFRAARVLCSDLYVTSDPDLVPQDEVLARAHLLVIGAPHPQYRNLVTELPVADIWNVRGQGTVV